MNRFLIVLVGLGLSGLAAAGEPCALDKFAPTGGFVAESAQGLGLDATISEALRHVAATPGFAIGIVENGRPIYVRGFGRRDLDRCQPVTENTVFYLYSLTKSFTGMGAALLQEAGEVQLDSSLADAFEGLTLPEPINPAQISLRDLLLHRPGFWSGGINYRTAAPGNLDDEGVVHLMQTYARPGSTKFGYSNVGYVVAAAAIRRITELDWTTLLEERVFGPAGMQQSTTSIDRAQAGEFARGYAVSPDGGFEARPVKRQAQMHAAGGSASNVTDLLRWITLNLEGGRLDGRQVFPARVLRQVHAPQIQYDRSFGRYQRFAYGLGVHNADLEGELTLHHFGGPIHVSFQPERRRGIVALSAGPDSTGFVHELAALVYRALNRTPGEAPSVEEFFAPTRARLEERLAERRQEREEFARRRRPPARPPSFYAGVYSSDRLGDIVLSARGDAVRLQYGAIEQPLTPLEPDTFLADLLPGGGSAVVLEFREENGAALFWGERRFDRLDSDPGR